MMNYYKRLEVLGFWIPYRQRKKKEKDDKISHREKYNSYNSFLISTIEYFIKI